MEYINSIKGSRRNIAGSLFILLLTIAYLFVHLLSLDWFPFVHSDEVWLATLSRQYIETNPKVTESFFVVTPRYPHAIKIIYHYIQGLFVFFNWSVFSARIPSLISGFIFLSSLFVILFRQCKKLYLSFFVLVIIAVNPAFFYISHLARQEMMIAAVGFLSLAIMYRTSQKMEGLFYYKVILAGGLVLGAGFLIHPNVVIMSLAIIPWVWFLPDNTSVGIKKRMILVSLFVLSLLIMAFIAFLLSLFMDKSFIEHYASFGSSVGVFDNIWLRLANFKNYCINMFFRNAGTYYLPPVMITHAFFCFVSACGFVCYFIYRKPLSKLFWMGISSYLLSFIGVFAIGKYSPPGAIFHLIWLPIVIFGLVESILSNQRIIFKKSLVIIIFLAVPVFAFSVQLYVELSAWYPAKSRPGTSVYYSYQDLLAEINSKITDEKRVLGNLNLGFGISPERLRVWRDLSNLNHQDSESVLDSAIARFIRDEKIGWIVLSKDEMDFIYANRPVWNQVYGNLYPLYPAILRLLEQYGQELSVHYSPWYGLRLLSLMPQSDHKAEQSNMGKIVIYQIQLPNK